MKFTGVIPALAIPVTSDRKLNVPLWKNWWKAC